MAEKTRSITRRVAGLLLRLLLLAVVGLVALLVYLHSDDAAERFRLAVIRLGSDQLGEDLYVREVRLESLTPPALVLRELRVHDRGGQPLVAVDEVHVALASLPVPWRRVVAVSSLRVVQPSARVALEGGQPRDFQRLIERLKRERPPDARPWKVQLGNLDVEQASARLSLDPAGLHLAVDGFDLAFSQDDRGDGAGTIEARSIEVAIGEVRETALLEPGTFDVAAGVVTVHSGAVAFDSGRIEVAGVIGLPDPPGAVQARPARYGLTARAEVELPRLEAVWPKLPVMEGTIDLAVGLNGEGLEPLVTFNVQGEGVAVHLTKPRPMVFKGESPSLIGHLEDRRIVLEPESALQWGGGVIRPEGWFDLTGEMPFEVEFELRELQLERVLDSATVPGSWVSMGMDGSGHLAGHAKGGFFGQGAARVAVRDMQVRDKPWDGGEQGTLMLTVPRAVVEAGLTVTSTHMLLEPATIRGPNSLLDVSCDFLFLKPLGLVISVDSQRFDSADLDHTISGLHFEGVGSVEAFVEGQTRDLDIRGSLELDEFVFTKWPFGQVRGDVHWHTREDLEFTSLRGHRGETDFEAEVRTMFADVRRGGERSKAEIAVDVVVPEGHGRAQDLLPVFFGDSIPVTGPAWGEVSLFGRPDSLDGHGVISGRDVGFMWETFSSLDVKAQVRAGRLTIEEGFARKPSGQVLFARGSIDKGGEVDFEFRLPRLEINQLDPVARLLPGRPSSDLIELAGGTGPWATGIVAANARIGGTLNNITLDGALSIDDLVYRGTALGDTSATFRIEDHRLTVDGEAMDKRLVGKAQMKTDGLWDYQYGVRWDRFSLTPFLPRTILAQTEPVTAGMSGRLEGIGTLRDGFHDVVLSLRDIWLERGRHRMEAPPDRPVTLRYDRGAFRFEHVELVSPEGGEGTTDLRVEGWIRPEGPLDVRIDGTVDIAFADLAYDVFDRAEAQALILNVELAGMSTREVDIEGKAQLKGALLKTIYWPHPFEVDNLEVQLQDRHLVITGFEGRMGGGSLEGVAGSFIVLDRTGYKPREFGLKAKCVGCTVRFPSFMPPTTGTADIRFQGTAPDDLELSGHVLVEELVLRDPLNWQRSVLTFGSKFTETVARAEKPALFDVALTFDSLPGAVGMRNNVGLLVATAQGFQILGDTNHVILDGTVQLDSGNVPFSGHDFEFEPGGTARFVDRESWFPLVDVRMSTDVRSRDENYRITYFVTGPLNDPTLEAQSEPALTEADINSLLLFGLTQEQLAEAELSDVLIAGAGAAGGTYGETAVTSAGQAAGEAGAAKLIPDRIEIVPVYTDTTGATTVWVVATKELPQPVDMMTLEAGFGLFTTSETITMPTVARIQLRFGRNVYLEGSWLRDDEASQSYGNFGLDLKFGVELE
jgi:hypothetical protein